MEGGGGVDGKYSAAQFLDERAHMEKHKGPDLYSILVLLVSLFRWTQETLNISSCSLPQKNCFLINITFILAG